MKCEGSKSLKRSSGSEIASLSKNDENDKNSMNSETNFKKFE